MIAVQVHEYVGEYPYVTLTADPDIWFRACSRCQGAGHYSFDGFSTVCYRCDGAKADPDSPRFTSVEAERDSTKRTKARDARIAKKAREAAEIEERVAAKVDRFKTEHPSIFSLIEAESDRGGFLGDMASILYSHRNIEREFTSKQFAVLERMAAEREERLSKQSPVPDGKHEVVGAIRSLKYVDGMYGVTLKAVIEDDRGFRVYGTLPAKIARELEERTHGDQHADDPARDDEFETVRYWMEEARGAQVSFTATLQQSQDEEAFGYFKRPSKPQLIS